MAAVFCVLQGFFKEEHSALLCQADKKGGVGTVQDRSVLVKVKSQGCDFDVGSHASQLGKIPKGMTGVPMSLDDILNAEPGSSVPNTIPIAQIPSGRLSEIKKAIGLVRRGIFPALWLISANVNYLIIPWLSLGRH